jgi:DNA-binding PadR family transcriptional regulator
MMEELARHGYKLGPGTLYPLLHWLELDGLLRSESEVVAGKARKYYVATDKGRAALAEIRPKVAELIGEALTDEPIETDRAEHSRQTRRR